MGDKKQTDQPKKAKQAKKLVLSKETEQELSEQELDQVAGGIILSSCGDTSVAIEEATVTCGNDD